jgi:hypothetical protein
MSETTRGVIYRASFLACLWHRIRCNGSPRNRPWIRYYTAENRERKWCGVCDFTFQLRQL